MLALSSPRWSDLRHAYGSASDVPSWLVALQSLPSSGGEAEPWFSIWSALAHQGDVFDASYAAVPHVVAALSTAPEKADQSFFQFPAWVEICRAKGGPEIPSDLSEPYFVALSRLPALASRVTPPCEPGLLVCCLAAVAVANGQVGIAECVLELSPDVAQEFLEWFSQR